MATILIVDDDAALREGLAEALADFGHQAAEAPDGATALRHLGRGNPADAVLLDLRMPGMDGLEVLRRIRALPAPPPVAVLTAVPTAANTIEAMRLGAVDHLPKPVGREELAALVARLLQTAPPDAGAGGGRRPAASRGAATMLRGSTGSRSDSWATRAAVANWLTVRTTRRERPTRARPSSTNARGRPAKLTRTCSAAQ